MSGGVDRTQHVLDMIDGALGDPWTSGDAMRWSPEQRPAGAILVRGGSPVALALAERLDDPEFRRQLLAAVGDAWARLVEQLWPAVRGYMDACEALMRRLADIRIVPERLPADPRERALLLARQRNTGPDRDVTRQRRPRLHR